MNIDRALATGSGAVSAIGVVVSLSTTTPWLRTGALAIATLFGLLCLGLLVQQVADAVRRKRKKRTASASTPQGTQPKQEGPDIILKGNLSWGNKGAGYFFGKGAKVQAEDNAAWGNEGDGFVVEGDDSKEPDKPKD